MKWLDSLSPTKLAGLGGAGNVLVLLTCFAASVRLSERPTPTPYSWAVVVLGFTVMIWAERRLRRGVAAMNWPDPQVEALQGTLGSPLLKAAKLVSLLAMFLASVFAPRGNAGALSSTGMMAAFYIDWVGAAVTPPRSGPPRVDWSGAAPLHSQHWGERGMSDATNSLGQSRGV